MKVNLFDAIVTLTQALDLVGVDETFHGKRVAVMAGLVAEALGWDKERRLFLVQAGMLHDCGVSSTVEHRHLVNEMEWRGAEDHCQRGRRYLEGCAPLAGFAETILYHHTRWDALDDLDIAGRVKEDANLLFLADRVDSLQAPVLLDPSGERDILWEKDAIVDKVKAYADGLFAPHLVEAFVAIASTEAFWLSMDAMYLERNVTRHARHVPATELDLDGMHDLAFLFARVVDAKSPFTNEHSVRVAALARHIAVLAGLGRESLDLLEIAGLLHDLGKLRLPDTLLEKDGPLDERERSLVVRHAFDSYEILDQLFPGTPIAQWAGDHHENLLGTGYPFHLKAREIDPEARILAVADIFQALAQDRPYRDHLPADEIMAYLDGLAEQGRLSADMVGLVRGDLEGCYRIAREG